MPTDAEARRDSNLRVLKTDVADPLAVQARERLREFGAAISNMRVDDTFGRAVRLLHSVDGHVIVTGLGKSGLVGQKVASTLASTGTPSFFVHSAEALHGDLGMITSEDAVILISYSGETTEVISLLPHLRQRAVPMLAMVGSLDSTLSCAVDVALDISVDAETPPGNLAPTASTLATLAIADALAVALTSLRGIGDDDIARLHPARPLGRQLMRVGDVAVEQHVTIVARNTPLRECVVALTQNLIPLALVYDGDRLLGVISAKDIDQALRTPERLAEPVERAMSSDPVVIPADVLVGEAERRMENEGLDAVLVADRNGRVRGILTRPKSR